MRGPCPFKINKSIWHLLAKGIGQRHFRRLITKVNLSFFVYVLHHHANMLTMLRKCQFINSGLISIPKRSSNAFYLFILVMTIASVNSSPANDRIYYNNGIRCYGTTCPAGYETVPCTDDGKVDSCRPCPADKYQEQDNVTSEMKLRCYSVKFDCMPDTQHLVQMGPESAANPPKCLCDTSRGYYQRGPSKDDCKKKICPSTEQLLLNGSCVCKEGRTLNLEGRCVWQIPDIPDLTPPAVKNTQATSATTSGNLTSPNSTEGQESHDNGTNSETTVKYEVINKNSETILKHEVSNKPVGSTSIPSSTAAGTGTTSDKHGSKLTAIIILVVILLIVIVVIVILVGRKYLRKQRRSIPMSGHEEPDVQPTQNITGKNVYVQIGQNNTMFGTGADDEIDTPPSA